MKNAFRVVSIWADGWKQVEGYYDTMAEAKQAISQYETNKAVDYVECVIYQDFRI